MTVRQNDQATTNLLLSTLSLVFITARLASSQTEQPCNPSESLLDDSDDHICKGNRTINKKVTTCEGWGRFWTCYLVTSSWSFDFHVLRYTIRTVDTTWDTTETLTSGHRSIQVCMKCETLTDVIRLHMRLRRATLPHMEGFIRAVHFSILTIFEGMVYMFKLITTKLCY